MSGLLSLGTGMMETVELAREGAFAIGCVTALPPRRELVRGDGARDVVEHRVMQVLIALAKADGAIVTRDELSASCWQGRVVGEDALNRVISRLRRTAEGIGAGSFRIETVTKIGYRLVADGHAVPAADLVPAEAPRAASISRRRVAIGLGVAAAAAGGGWLLTGGAKPKVSPAIRAMMEKGWNSLLQQTRESQNQSIALYRHVTELAPDFADGWGALGIAYACTSHYRSSQESQAMRARAVDAGKHALALDPANAYGRAALADARPIGGNWGVIERTLRAVLIDHPRNEQVMALMGAVLGRVGRNADALRYDEMIQADTAPPGIWYHRILSLWSLGRLEEADRVIAQADALYPTQYALWFERFYIWMYTGRAREAIALGENPEKRPSGIPESEFNAIVDVARTIETPSPAAIDRVMTHNMARARQANGYAANTIQFASALGRIDEAFAVTEAYFFGRGFAIPDLTYAPEQGAYSSPGDRDTGFLFWPSTRAMRADPRFARLMEEAGLERYWREAGARPDFRRL